MTTTRESLLREAQTATEDYRAAWRDLDDQLALQRLGMSNHVMLATYRERAAYDRWMAASERSVAQSPAPPPKPTATVAPKIATAPVTPKPAAPVAANPTASTTAESATVAGIRLRAEHAALSAAMTRNAQAQHEARERLYREERAKAEVRIKGLR